MVTYHTADYYFSSHSGSNWTNPDNLDDNNTTTFATCTGHGVEYIHTYDDNTCTSSNLGPITQVLIRTSGYIADGGGYCSVAEYGLSPYYDGNDMGGFCTVSSTTDDYTAWADITTATNAPETWTFSNIKSKLTCRTEAFFWGSSCSDTAYAAVAQLRVVWRDNESWSNEQTETLTATSDIDVPAATLQSETIDTSDDIINIQIYLVRVLEYIEELNNQYKLTLKVSSDKKSVLDSALEYAGKLATFSKPFGDVVTYDGTSADTNTVGFMIKDCPNGITNPLILVIDDYMSEIIDSTTSYLYTVSGYKYV